MPLYPIPQQDSKLVFIGSSDDYDIYWRGPTHGNPCYVRVGLNFGSTSVAFDGAYYTIDGQNWRNTEPMTSSQTELILAHHTLIS